MAPGRPWRRWIAGRARGGHYTRNMAVRKAVHFEIPLALSCGLYDEAFG